MPFGWPAVVVPFSQSLAQDQTYNPLGCVGSFRESGSVGFQINSAIHIIAAVEHTSHAGLCELNSYKWDEMKY